jgi:SAM-dependent methyltransferase
MNLEDMSPAWGGVSAESDIRSKEKRSARIVLQDPGIRLHLGAGKRSQEGWINQDMYPAPGIDLVFDLMGTWPLEDNSVSAAYACHVLEHLPDPQHFFRELWRVCQPNASVTVRVPYGGNDLALSDITHLRSWFAPSFCFLQPGYAAVTGNGQHAEWKWPYGVGVIQARLNGKIARKLRHWYWRIWLWPYLTYMWNSIEELIAYLYVLKSPEAEAEYASCHGADMVFVQYVAWKHQVYGIPAPLTGEPLELMDIANGEPISATYKV